MKNSSQGREQEIADDLLRILDEARRTRWIETVDSAKIQTSSTEAWSLLRKLGGAKKIEGDNKKISANTIAAQIKCTSRAPRDKPFTRQIKRKFRAINKISIEQSEYSNPFTTEIMDAIQDVKAGRGPGNDGIHPELLGYSRKLAKRCLVEFFWDIVVTGTVSHKMKQSKTIAILKPGKPNDYPKNYTPLHC